jgi:ubiquinone/menaquinone biosynthesis C-methylase UbiE
MKPIAAYDEIADWYDASVRSGNLLQDLVAPGLVELAGDIAGRGICDLACGQGVVAREFAARGARVVGIDLSARLLALARRDEPRSPLGVAYVRDDAQSLAAIADASFDGVVCSMALMDIPNLGATFRATHRVLRRTGWFVFAITHPCFQTPFSEQIEGSVQRRVGGYFAEGFWRSDHAEGVRGKVGAYHRTLATYVNGLAEAGFVVRHLREPIATGAVAERLPGCRELPAVLCARCEKLPTSW